MASVVPITRLSVGPERARLIRGRIEEIAGALDLPAGTVEKAMRSDGDVIAFVYATNQSFDWVVLGSMASTVRALHQGGRTVWAPSIRLLAKAQPFASAP